MKNVFFIVGPTAVGKSEIAAEVASVCNGEVISADAFQIYAGLDLLTAKPDEATQTKAPHHLIGTTAVTEQMDAGRFRRLATRAINDVTLRGKHPFVVGGSGLYIKALTHGLSPLPPGNPELRKNLEALSIPELLLQLAELDRETARSIDPKNKHRVLRAVEICLLTGRPASALRQLAAPPTEARGVTLLRDRAELYRRIDQRVEEIFANGVIEEVRAIGNVGATAAKTLGLTDIRDLLIGKISQRECIARIQQASRRYAKRQLTWFARQTNFEPLNLSRCGSSEAVELIARIVERGKCGRGLSAPIEGDAGKSAR
ncbi:MAG: tRNA (adenosine(37)-N6)-dimethylallyltransferase MiaA [Chthoniobacterales bacterium]